MKLLETASASVCSKIIAANPQFAGAAQAAVTDVIDDINLEVRNNSRDHAVARTKVKRRKYWRELGDTDVQAAAREQDFEKTVIALSIFGRCPIEIAERAVLNENPGVVQVVAKAAGCSWATVKALLLMKAADRRMLKSDLDQARENFEQLETRTAKRVLEFYDARRNEGTVTSPPTSLGRPGAADVASR